MKLRIVILVLCAGFLQGQPQGGKTGLNSTPGLSCYTNKGNTMRR
jgi:hypothetical protein